LVLALVLEGLVLALVLLEALVLVLLEALALLLRFLL
jgi:hypothetical protein